MKRRIFLQTGAFGLIGLGVPSVVSAAVSNSPFAGVSNWFHHWVTVTGAQRRSVAGVPSEVLRQTIENINALWVRQDFDPRDSSLFFCNSGPATRCFYPLVLRRAAAGLTDFLTPVLEECPDGSWRTLVVLSGYQLEALARASIALAKQTEELPLTDLLMPAGPVDMRDGSIPTRRGKIFIETQLQKGEAFTQVQVQENGQVVFSGKFVSAHCLSHTPNAVAVL